MKLLLCLLVVSVAVVAGKPAFCWPDKWQSSIESYTGDRHSATFVNADGWFQYTPGDMRVKAAWNTVPGFPNSTIWISWSKLNVTFILNATDSGKPTSCKKYKGFINFWPQCSSEPGWGEYFPARLGGWGKSGGTQTHLFANTGDKMAYGQALLYKVDGVKGWVPDYIRVGNRTTWRYESYKFYNSGPLMNEDVFNPPAMCHGAIELPAEHMPKLRVHSF
eukprot:NODE_1607_length_795_cov_229.558383_g1558_i0.p2 GENE.NODE_1607_length_795_cov_229.558383_g1558_i0~~NODE_1607_length_795_cov_229.558383_g1558_i0.p2  ORF type:complete len:220 (+),score=45.93 NODE_1607_length_795_cov_229.558383_g1558_i0:65-724(+)